MSDMVDEYFRWISEKLRRRRPLEDKRLPPKPAEPTANSTISRRLRRLWNDKRN
jgi:hypothetical protein